MQAHRQEFSIKAMSRVLAVSRSGFYVWLCRQDNPSPRQRHREQIDAVVRDAFEACKGRC